MPKSLTETAVQGFTYVRHHPELLFSLLLIIVVPFGFLFSGQQFLSAAKDNQERLEKDRVGLLHDIFASYARGNIAHPEHIQAEIEIIAKDNPDITKFRIGKALPDGNVVILAALQADRINTNEMHPETFQIARIHPGESIITAYFQGTDRYWQAFRLFTDRDNTEYFLFTETSLVQTDALFAGRVTYAYYWLFALLAIVLLLLLRHVRLIDYGYLYRKVKKTNQTKDLFTNTIAHELRAPLTAMRGYASMIRENNDVPDIAREQAERIEQSSERLVLIVSDLLDVARIQSGKLKITKEVVGLAPIITSVVEVLAPSAHEKGVELSVADITGNILVLSDNKRLHQIFTNIISNAIKYTHRGTIEIAATTKRDRVEVRVKDTGMGISAADQQKLFAPFFRVSDTEVEAITGTGLGMWITKQFIELLDGSISVESIKGVGTHIVITLPVQKT